MQFWIELIMKPIEDYTSARMKSVSPLVFSASLKTIINIPTFIKSSSSIFNSLLGHPDPCERTKHFNKLSCHVRRMWAFCKQLVFKALPSILFSLIVVCWSLPRAKCKSLLECCQFPIFSATGWSSWSHHEKTMVGENDPLQIDWISTCVELILLLEVQCGISRIFAKNITLKRH